VQLPEASTAPGITFWRPYLLGQGPEVAKCDASWRRFDI
jgi:hypothetical protein